MQRFVSSYFGKPILLKRERAVVGIVEDFVIDPSDGRLAGLLVREGFGKKNLKALPEKSIDGIGEDFILVPEYESIGEIEEIVRIKKIIDSGVSILGNNVYTETGVYLGTVYDFTIDLKSLFIARLYVSKKILTFTFDQKIIGHKQIILIEKGKITVSDASIKLKKTALATKPIATS